MSKKIRLKEVAKKMGCSVATVSQAFHNPKRVNRKTRESILRTCEEMGYKRKHFTQKLRKVIGITGISHELILGEYYNAVTMSILSAAKEEGVNVVMECFDDQEETLPSMFSKRLLDGVLVLGKISPEHVLLIKQSGVPMVLCGHPIPGVELHTVLSDGRGGIYAATKHLIGLGHKKIAYITGGPLFDPVTSDRFDGYRYALSEAKIEVPAEYIIIGDFCDWLTGAKAVDKLMGLKVSPTAIVCESDALAYNAYQALKEKGFKIPKDVSIAGFDDLPFPPYINAVKPKLTTINVNLGELGRTSVEVLWDVIANPAKTAYRHTLPVELKVGETTTAVKK
ncbi:MAG: LacI family DNA-binding transcriptional regulator [Candidatus Saganbacteria bacterium]|nr:LacI family DNA-binding transcriptional regulator [Candidatus Saganbacteria bacterium]